MKYKINRRGRYEKTLLFTTFFISPYWKLLVLDNVINSHWSKFYFGVLLTSSTKNAKLNLLILAADVNFGHHY